MSKIKNGGSYRIAREVNQYGELKQENKYAAAV